MKVARCINTIKEDIMITKNILVVMPVKDKHKEQLEEAGRGYDFTYTTYDKVTGDMVKNANIIIGNVDPFFLQDADRLELLQLNSAGTDSYIKQGVLGENTVLTNATGAYGQAVAEHLFAVLFSIQKKLHVYRDNQQKCSWQDEGEIMPLMGGTLLIVGLGDIGMYFAKLAKLFGYYIIGVKRRVGEVPEGIDEIHGMDALDDLLPRADVILSILPDTPATRNVFQKEQFQKMKKTAILLNGGRGNAIHTEDLCNALITGEFYGAGLDVTDPEPLPQEHKLWNIKNVVITPHISGDFHLPQTIDRIITICAENIRHYQKGEPLINVVDMETGYKK